MHKRKICDKAVVLSEECGENCTDHPNIFVEITCGHNFGISSSSSANIDNKCSLNCRSVSVGQNFSND